MSPKGEKLSAFPLVMLRDGPDLDCPRHEDDRMTVQPGRSVAG